MSRNSKRKDVKAQTEVQKKKPKPKNVRNSKDMHIKIQFGVVVIKGKQEHSHSKFYGCKDYEECSAVFDLSNRTDGESVSDYPLWRYWSYCRGRR